MLHSKQWHYSLHRDFQNCHSTRRSPTGFFKAPIPAPILHVHITLQSREFSIQNPILHEEDKELFEYYTPVSRNSMHRRQGDLLEMHPCVLQDLPVTFQAFSRKSLQRQLQRHSGHSSHSWPSSLSRQFYNVPVSPGNPPRSSILRLEYIFYKFYSSIGFHRNSTEYQLGNYRHYRHSSKKGRCCDIGQIDRFYIIELFPLSSCQVIILIARMTFNCSTSCLMS